MRGTHERAGKCATHKKRMNEKAREREGESAEKTTYQENQAFYENVPENISIEKILSAEQVACVRWCVFFTVFD